VPSNLGIVASAFKEPTITGGTLYSDATYYYRVFTANGTLTVTSPSGTSVPVEVIVVAGGGPGGS
jgi:hypothetical protein